jgi:hypothetical protein
MPTTTPKKKADSSRSRSGAPMSEAHKKALAVGREQGRIIRNYLDALETTRPRRGRKRTVESVQRQLASVKQQLPDATGLDRVHLIQDRMDLEAELATLSGAGVDLAALEGDFVKVAAEYGDRKGISYTAWREAGVDAAVLKKAGITRGS